MHFDPKVAFDFPPGAFNFSLGFFLGLGAATRVGIYDYLGYYDVCYIGDEVRDPGRVIPRSILISTVAVALIYIGINLSIIGVVPWREFVPAAEHPESSFVVSVMMQKIYGSGVATIFTLLILWTAFGSVFALLLGYSRIPFAAATERLLFSRVRPAASDERFPVRLTARARGDLDLRGILVARNRHRRADRYANRRAVHGTGRRTDAAAPARAGHAASVPHVALSAPRIGGVVGLDIRLRDHAVPGDFVWRWCAGTGMRRVHALVAEHQALAIWRRGCDVVKPILRRGYLASGSGRSWNFMTLLVVPLPPSI